VGYGFSTFVPKFTASKSDLAPIQLQAGIPQNGVMSFTNVVIDQAWVSRNWWCADCRVPTDLDRHGRCGTCGSDAVDMASRPNQLATVTAMQPEKENAVLDVFSRYIRVA
jgi:hypothetical protein